MQKKNSSKRFDKKNATKFVVLSKAGGGQSTGEYSANNKEFVPVRPPNLKGKWKPSITLNEEKNGREKKDDAIEEPLKAGEIGVKVGNFRADDFALGEYGFPDDGYDYAQHFAPMGGGKYFPAGAMGDLTAANRQKAGVAAVPDFAHPTEELVDFVSAKKGIVSEEGAYVPFEHQFSDPDEDDKEVLKELESSGSEDENWRLQDDFMAVALGDKEEGHEDDIDDTTSKSVKDKGKGEATNNEAPPKKIPAKVRFADADFSDDDDDDDYKDDDDDEERFRDYEDDEEFDEEEEEGKMPRFHFEERHGDTVMDKWLDHVMEEEYDDDQMGEGDEEALWSTSEHRGNMKMSELDQYLNSFMNKKKQLTVEAYKVGDQIDAEEKAKILALGQKALENSDDEVEVIETVVVDKQWDCQSILSTYSNLANHPHILDVKEKKEKPVKPRAPVSFADASSAAKEEEEDEDGDNKDKKDVKTNKGAARKKTETPEERKARKAQVKNERKKSRQAKKETKVIYKQEESAQKKALDATPFHSKTVIPM